MKTTPTDIKAVCEVLRNLRAQEPMSYDPEWIATTTNPVLGSSTLTGIYWTLLGMCYVNICLKITTGGSFNKGSGSYAITTPIVSSNVPDTDAWFTGTGMLLDESGATDPITLLIPRLARNSNQVFFYYTKSAEATGMFAAAMTDAAPVTLATGDMIRFSISFPIGRWL